MKIGGIDVKQTIETAKLILEQDDGTPKASKALFKVILVLLEIMLEKLYGDKVKLFDTSTEKSSSLQGNEDGNDSNQNSSEGEKEAIEVSAYTRKKKITGSKKKIDYSKFPTLTITHELPEEQKSCDCCNSKLHKIDTDISYKMEIIPSLFYTKKHIRYKYGCRNCQKLIMAPKPFEVLPKSAVGSSVIAEVATNKFQYHLPLYRQVNMFFNQGAEFSSNTLCNWIIRAGDQLMSLLAKPLWQKIQEAKYLQVDESPVKVQVENKKGYIWVYYAPYVGSGLVMFEFSTTRSGSVAEQSLQNFSGLLQTDGYAGYNRLRNQKNIQAFGCLTHARRRFVDVIKITKNNKGIANEFVEMVKPLYILENKMKLLKFNSRARKIFRKKWALPILHDIKKWLHKKKPSVLPNSALGKAISYARSNWPLISKYARHGMAEIDTNYVENQIRPSAVGKKNWLHVNNQDTGNINAFWFSLVQSAIFNGINPKEYIHFLLFNIHNIRRNKSGFKPEEVMPHTLNKKLLIEFNLEKLKIAQKIFNDSS